VIRPLSELRAGDAGAFGGKAANLGELISIGMAVPKGYAVRAGATGRAVSAQLLAIFDALGREAVAVRSSATVEDSGTASYAGLFHTSLDVRRAGLLPAYETCVASADSPRVHAYRAALGAGFAPIRMGVVVQEMLAPELAGVCFTANPATRAPGEFLIEVASGHAEPIVSGRASPDSYLFDEQIGRITSARRGDSERKESPGGTHDLLSAARRRAVTHVARCAAIVQAHFGRPQDMEFAIQEGAVYILQARPIVAGVRPAPRDMGR